MFIADFHIHSKYSIATSKDCVPEWLDYWARCKGLGVVGTGDFTHPAWRKELEEKLEPAEDGLYAIGILRSDGRPILGLDSRDLLESVLDLCPEAILIPAHIWTPHFSVYGAYSGFDDITECFEELSEAIFALETGLSSDPPMNWHLSALAR